MNETICISVEKYEELLEIKTSVKVLKRYVESCTYPDKDVMFEILGVESKEEE